ncbi:hypothetical protein ACFWA9_09830 [Kitasatospora sp. NPDC059973]|uniref:hypothetical protein n=1 Tax=Kitasatospora sp. NPDC059973 TaxID=3347020 RepID=UPI00369FC93B
MTYVIKGTSNRAATCDECGKDVQRPIQLETIDLTGNPLGHRTYVGVDCAATRTRRSVKAVEADAARADRAREADARRQAEREAFSRRYDQAQLEWLRETYGVTTIDEASEKTGKDWIEIWTEARATLTELD